MFRLWMSCPPVAAVVGIVIVIFIGVVIVTLVVGVVIGIHVVGVIVIVTLIGVVIVGIVDDVGSDVVDGVDEVGKVVVYLSSPQALKLAGSLTLRFTLSLSPWG